MRSYRLDPSFDLFEARGFASIGATPPMPILGGPSRVPVVHIPVRPSSPLCPGLVGGPRRVPPALRRGMHRRLDDDRSERVDRFERIARRAREPDRHRQRRPTASRPAMPAAAFPTTLTDDEGTAVTLKAEPQKIVSLTPATTEILFALGAGPRVVATTDFDDYPPAALALPHVASYTSVDVEKIVGLGTDLVIAGGNSFNPPDVDRQLRELGVPVLVVYAPDTAGVLKDIELVGTRRRASTSAAKELTTAMQARLRRGLGGDRGPAQAADVLRARHLDRDDLHRRPTTRSWPRWSRWPAVEPITTGSTTDFAIPLEKLITADPEVILLGDGAYGVTADQVKARSGWNVMTAVKNDAIRPANDIVITRPGPRLVEGLRELALAIHPDSAALDGAGAAPMALSRRGGDPRRDACRPPAPASAGRPGCAPDRSCWSGSGSWRSPWR